LRETVLIYHLAHSLETPQYIGIKLTVKADKATHIPYIEKIDPIAREVHAIVLKELLASND
jgi:hypothetical protein